MKNNIQTEIRNTRIALFGLVAMILVMFMLPIIFWGSFLGDSALNFQKVIENNKYFSLYLVLMGGFLTCFISIWLGINIKIESAAFLLCFPMLSTLVYIIFTGDFLLDFIDNSFIIVHNFQEQKEDLKAFHSFKSAIMCSNFISFLTVFLLYIRIRGSLGSSDKIYSFFFECIIVIMIFFILLGYAVLFSERYSN